VYYPPRNPDNPGSVLDLTCASSGRMATLAAHATKGASRDDHGGRVVGERPRILTEALVYVRPMAGDGSWGRTAQRGTHNRLLGSPDIHPYGCILGPLEEEIMGLLPEPTSQ